MQIKHNNLGTVNTNEVILEKDNARLVLTFSYETCVGIYLRTDNTYISVCHTNDWSTTTGKLLNKLESDKSKRLSADNFAIVLQGAIKDFEQA